MHYQFEGRCQLEIAHRWQINRQNTQLCGGSSLQNPGLCRRLAR
jgi:hypothetical protein